MTTVGHFSDARAIAPRTSLTSRIVVLTSTMMFSGGLLAAPATERASAAPSSMRAATDSDHLRTGDDVRGEARLAKRARRRPQPSPPPPAPATTPPDAPAPAAASQPPPPAPPPESPDGAPDEGGGGLEGRRSGPSRIEFDDRLIQGQTNKANAIYLFERRASELRSLVRPRQHYHKEIDESVR
jgi:hypothetical protein